MTGMSNEERPASYYLHVGLPKTGTTFLQAQLEAHRDALLEHGVLYPELGGRGRFLAALDGRDVRVYAGVKRPAAAGRWAAFVEQTRDHPGKVLFSHEVMGAPQGSDPPTALRALESHRVHIVLTVRDPAHQLVSTWQQSLRYKSSRTFTEFMQRSRFKKQNHYRRSAFRNQHVDSVLRAWAQFVPAERIHVVTVPPTDAPRELLWDRFCTLLGLDAGCLPVRQTSSFNPSLGVAQLEHLRRINAAIGDRIRDDAHAARVRTFIRRVLAATAASPRPVIPADAYEIAEMLADRWTHAIRDGGYDVVGDLDDLRPRSAEGRAPDDWTANELIAVGSETSARLLIAYVETQNKIAKARSKLANPDG